MIAEEDFDCAADESEEMAFVRLERKFREVYEQKIADSGSNEQYGHCTLEYMNHTVAAAKALGLNLFEFWELPSDTSGHLYEEYHKFRNEVDRFTVHIQVQHVRTSPKNSVALDPSEKKHLRAYADAIKDTVDKSSLPIAKKERLFDKINAFITELDRDRTPIQRFTDVILALANTGGGAATEMEPAWKWAKLAAAIFGVRQETEQTKLPRPPKKIEPPRRQIPPPKKSAGSSRRVDMDDEIPF